MIVNKIYIYLAGNEWGNELMRKVADDFARDNAGRPLIVEVHEHAGWYLAYLYGAPHIDDGTICGTANDGASLSPAVVRFGRSIEKIETLPEIRR